MSRPGYDVLTALSVADGGRMQITVLAAQIGWERAGCPTTNWPM